MVLILSKDIFAVEISFSKVTFMIYNYIIIIITYDFEGPSVTGTASGEVSNIGYNPNLARIFGSLFRHTLGDIGPNPR